MANKYKHKFNLLCLPKGSLAIFTNFSQSADDYTWILKITRGEAAVILTDQRA